MNNLRWISVSLLAAVLVFATACGGGSDDDDGSTGATGSTGSVSAPASSGSTGGSGGASTGSAAPAPGSDGTLNVDSVASSLEDVDSFRFNMKLSMDFDTAGSSTGSSEDAAAAAFLMALLGNIEVEGAYVAPDRVQTSSTFFGMDVETIQIGEQSWTNDGSGWTVDASGGTTDMLPFDLSEPSDIFELIPTEELEGAETSQESVNGFDTTRYHFDKESLAALTESAGETAGLGDLGEVGSLDLDIWITEDGFPVKMLMDMQGESEGSEIAIQMEFNVTDVNDSSISIEAPI